MSLKATIRNHICQKLIEDTINEFNDGVTAFLLILDDESSQILSSYLTMSELINLELFSVDSINKKRKPYKTMHAIYFISPKSCSLVEKDFLEKGKLKNLYKRAHIFFTTQISDDEISTLVKPDLVPRILTLKESNANFFIADKNTFYFNPYSFYTNKENGKSLFSYLYLKENSIIDENVRVFCEKIASVCIVMNQFPNIAYYKEDKVCRRIAMIANSELNNFYKENNTNPCKTSILLITSRLMDLCAPLLYDMTYSSMIYDSFKKNSANSVFLENEKVYILDDNDGLYTKYKNYEFSDALTNIQTDFETFAKGIKSKKSANTFEEINAKVRTFAEIEKSKKEFSAHMDFLRDIQDKIKENSIMDVIDVQSSIISGISAVGTKLKYKDIVKSIKKLANKVNTECLIRLLSCLNFYLDLTKEDLDNALENINEVSEISPKREKMIQFFSKNNSFNKEQIDSLDKEIMLYRSKNMDSKSIEKDNRYLCVKETKLATIVDMCANSVLPLNHFEYLQEVKSKKKKKAKILKFGGMDDDEDEAVNNAKNYMFVFTFGGISYNEIASIEKVSKGLDYQIVIGGNTIMSAKEYLKQADIYANKADDYDEISSKDSKKAKKKKKELISEEEDEDVKPKKKKKELISEEEDEDVKPKKKKKVLDEEEDEEVEKPKKKKKVLDEEDEEEDKKDKTPKKKKKSKLNYDDED